MNSRQAILAACACLVYCIADAQEGPVDLQPPAIGTVLPAANGNGPVLADDFPEPALPDLPTPEQVRFRTGAVIAAYAAGIAIYGGQKWWNEGIGRFESTREGWFGQHTYAGGADKLGHFFANYASTRLFTSLFKSLGNEPDHALRLGAITTLSAFTLVEVMDGFATNWHFSKEDAIMNAIGTGVGILMETQPQLDQVLDLRLMYRPSHEPGAGFSPFSDYSGQTYLAVVKANGFPRWREHPVMRYVEFAVGYGTRGFSGEPGKANPALVPRRHIYFGISLNLSELLDRTVFRGAAGGGRTQAFSRTFLEYIQIPGTVLLADHRLPTD